MKRENLFKTDLTERAIYSAIARHDGIKAKDIAPLAGCDRETVNHYLYASPFLKELCWQDASYRWHGIVRQTRPHSGLEEYCGYYSTVSEFLSLGEEEWFARLTEGCTRIGRNLNDTRGLFHSFLDARQVMTELFHDLEGIPCDDWELVFELRLKRAKHIRIYADVLVITEDRVFSLEFKMKDKIDPAEVEQAAKYTGYLEVLFGPDFDVIPALILTQSFDLYDYAPIGATDASLPVCSGNMLFNLFDEYLGFLKS